MFLRSASTHLVLLALAVSGCDCADEPLAQARPRLEVTPRALDFGDVLVGEQRALGVSVANVGTLPLTITSTTLTSPTGELTLDVSPPRTLAPDERVQAVLFYTPVDTGEDLGSLTIASNDGDPAITVSLRGVGVLPGVGVTTDAPPCGGQPGSMSFGDVRPGATSTRTITIQSTGAAPLEVRTARVEGSGEWSIDASALPTTVPPGGTLALVARYAPVDGGSDAASFVLGTSVGEVRVAACGAGVAAALCARPVPLALGAASIGAVVRGTLTLESCGREPLELVSIRTSTDARATSAPGFAIGAAPTTPRTLAPGETVDVEVTYTAALPFGAKRGFVQIVSSALGQRDTFVPVDARTASPCALFAAPEVLSFRGVGVGQRTVRSALIGNAGESDCAIASLAVSSTTSPSAPFALVGSSTSTAFVLASGASRIVELAYTPQDPGPHRGLLRATDVGGATYDVRLVGNPPEVSGCAVDVTPTVLGFGVTAIGQTARLGLRVQAIGDLACRIESATIVGMNPAFAATLPLGRTALPGIGGVTIDVAFTPQRAGTVSDRVRVSFAPLGAGAGGGTIDVGVSGSSADARICVTPARLSFGTLASGGLSTQAVSITSCGGAALDLRGANITTGPPFTVTQQPMLPTRLAAGAVAAPPVRITYAPESAGPHFGLLEILSSDPMNPVVRVPIDGNFSGNCAEVLECRPGRIAFGDTDVGTTKPTRVTCTSLGTRPVTISAASLSNASPELSVTAATPRTLAPGESWSFDVTYAPTAPTTASGTLTLTTNGCVTPPPWTVSGQGREPPLPPCQPPSTFSPMEQWRWDASTIEPTFTNVWSTPLVANLDDDNGDGRVDENDIPEVIFLAIDAFSFSDAAASIPAVLRVISGDTGREKFTVTNPRFADSSILAVGDLDGDGRPEIVGSKWVQTPPGSGAGGFFGRYVTGSLVALDATGRLLWESEPWQWPSEVGYNASAPAIADLDGDGFAEIVLGRDVYDHRGRLRWRGTGSYGRVSGGVHSIVADLDLDGRPEVIAGGTVYRGDGTILWNAPGGLEGGTAVGQLDLLDPYPHVVVHLGSRLVVFDHLGMEQWRQDITTMGPATLLPILADFDGDGDTDIAVADGEAVQVFRGTGGLMWTNPVTDSTCCVGMSAFDFEGDGAYELILNDNGTVYTYRGTNGQTIYRASRPSPTAYELPVVADVDNDRKAELLVALFTQGGRGGIVAYSNVGDTWVSAPRIWNQQAFHVTNVTEAGGIPRTMTPVRNAPRVFRGTRAACR